MKRIRLLIFILIANICFAVTDNLYQEYLNAEKYYADKEYIKGIDKLETLLKVYPEYSQAKVLYFKLLHETQEREKLTQISADIIKNEDDNTKEEIFKYLNSINDVVYAEKFYYSFENKTKVDKIYVELLFKNKKYKKISTLSTEEKAKYIGKIEEKKNSADKLYYQALADLKKNRVNDAVKSLESAVDVFPENQIYYIKLGEIYADNKNFYLAEINFKEALKYSDEKKIYENLFSVYMETKNYDSLYEVSKYISDIPFVKENIKRITESLARKIQVTVLKREGNKIYIDRTFFKESKIGDSFHISKEKERIEDKNTGQYFGFIPEVFGKIRLYNFSDKVAVFVVLEEYKNIYEQESFFLF